MYRAHIEGLEGVVVSGDYDQENVYKLVCSGFGLKGEYMAADPVIKTIKPCQALLFQDLFEDDVGKLIKDIFEISSVIFVLKEELVTQLTSSLPSSMAKKVALFSSIFGMEPTEFITASPYMLFEIDPNDQEALALEVASYIQNVLLDSYIFGPWMMYIKELARKCSIGCENLVVEKDEATKL